MTEPVHDEPIQSYVHRHLRFAWGTMLLFVTFGVVLEMLHAFKVAAYLDVGQETRRWLWTLAHAHGIGLALAHAAFAWTVKSMAVVASRSLRWASRLLVWATWLLPGGFLLGGLVPYESDPGVGIALVPLGAAALWTAVLLICIALRPRE